MRTIIAVVALTLAMAMIMTLGAESVYAHSKARSHGVHVPANLTRLQPVCYNGQCNSHMYKPVQVKGNTITVDCDHEMIYCDDEGA